MKGTYPGKRLRLYVQDSTYHPDSTRFHGLWCLKAKDQTKRFYKLCLLLLLIMHLTPIFKYKKSKISIADRVLLAEMGQESEAY